MTKLLSELIRQRKPVEALLGGILNDGSQLASAEAGQGLLRQAAEYGVDVQDFLTLAIDPHEGEFARKYHAADLSGFELALAYLGLPVKNDFTNGVCLQAAADTFQTYTGTRALFPAVIDAMLKFANRQNIIERVEPLLANSRTIAGMEQITTVVSDDSAERGTFSISEGGNIPVRSVRSSENVVKIWKHGSGYEFTYEFGRRASLDIVTPFANRVNRELELSKVTAATHILINGDGVHSAAPTTRQVADWSGTAATKLEYKPLLKWLNSRAKAGVPVDVVVGNYEMYVEWLLLFTPTLNGNRTEAEAVAMAGGPTLTASLPGLFSPVSYAISSSVGSGYLVGITKGETLEELVEAGSQISESERAIRSQKVTYVKTENTGYKLAFGDTRAIYNMGA